MKIESRTINISIDIEEWSKIQSEYDKLRFGNNQNFYKENPNISEFFDSISTISNNRNHKIDKKL